ncbi:MAG: ThiF family adenylyltransferase [Vicinamibacterales bacterium]
MLADSQIDRYCRQIVLPEIGSRGQERLLQSAVSISGGGDAALVCATYLAAAGVGEIGLSEAGGPSRLAPLLGNPRERNPDCRLRGDPPQAPRVAIAISALPSDFPPSTTVLCAVTDSSGIHRVRFAPGRACAECLRELWSRALVEPYPTAELLLGSLLATDSLRSILGLGDSARSEVLRIDLDRGAFSVSPFHGRSDCPRCGPEV